ncbi:MAG: hypothetical protein H7843_14425 [Nitrospirota bacterium]
MRLTVLLVVSTVLLSPKAGFAAKCKDQFYIISLKDAYLKKKYKVRAFFFIGTDVYGVTKMPKDWLYSFPDKQGYRLIGLAETDKEVLDIGYFQDFLSVIMTKSDEKPYFSMMLIGNKPDGTVELLKLETRDFTMKKINKCFKRYSLNPEHEP